ncbi:hypothetical protein [Paractinoplanes maris]|uniref:hypothetical protein n=1 Tax=Paractinoplanes maris TaxID=1734446 RepID=UPI002020719D|nr:hypothetical protein [Actinoplanes maris]
MREPKTHPIRRVARVMYLDAADSWPVQERSPSARTVFRTDYTAHLGTVWKPYRMWTVAYRPAAATLALLFDALKWLFIHPLRGPLTTSAAFLLYLIATH